MCGQASPPDWLATDGLLSQFAQKRFVAVRRYIKFVIEGMEEKSIWRELNRQIYLGDEVFVKRMQARLKGLSQSVGVPKVQKRAPAASLKHLAATCRTRDDGIVAYSGPS